MLDRRVFLAAMEGIAIRWIFAILLLPRDIGEQSAQLPGSSAVPEDRETDKAAEPPEP
jgi:hypothetical protein